MTNGPARMGQFIRTHTRPRNLNAFLTEFLTEPARMPMGAVIQTQKQLPDVSFYDGFIDWDVMRARTDAVIIREGQREWDDAQFLRNWREAKARGVYRGAYRFYDDRMSPGEQAKRMADHLSADPPELEAVIDWEAYYGGQFGGLANVVACMQRLQELLPKVRVMIYTGYYWFIGNSNPIANAAHYKYLANVPLWLAWYVSDPSVVRIPAPWSALLYWQYGTPAIGQAWGSQKSEIDMNYFNGSEVDFRTRYGVTTPPPIGDPMDYEVKAFTNIRTSPPGGTYVDIGDLLTGDTITGTMSTIGGYPWCKITAWRRNGNAMVLPVSASGEWWAYGVNLKEVTAPPPSGTPSSIELNLAPGSTYSIRDLSGAVILEGTVK